MWSGWRCHVLSTDAHSTECCHTWRPSGRCPGRSNTISRPGRPPSPPTMTSGFRPSCLSLVTILHSTQPTETAGLQAGAQTLRLVHCPLLGGQQPVLGGRSSAGDSSCACAEAELTGWSHPGEAASVRHCARMKRSPLLACMHRNARTAHGLVSWRHPSGTRPGTSSAQPGWLLARSHAAQRDPWLGGHMPSSVESICRGPKLTPAHSCKASPSHASWPSQSSDNRGMIEAPAADPAVAASRSEQHTPAVAQRGRCPCGISVQGLAPGPEQALWHRLGQRLSCLLAQHACLPRQDLLSMLCFHSSASRAAAGG